MNRVSDLLAATQLPIAFWNKVSQQPDYRDNPGTQLQSYLVARGLRNVFIDLPDDLNGSLAACKEFSKRITDCHKLIGYELFLSLKQVPDENPLKSDLSALLADKAKLDLLMLEDDKLEELTHLLIVFQQKFESIMSQVDK